MQSNWIKVIFRGESDDSESVKKYALVASPMHVCERRCWLPEAKSQTCRALQAHLYQATWLYLLFGEVYTL